MQVFWHGGAKVQITGHRSARSQVTGHRPRHRSDHRPQVRSQVRSQVTHKNNRTLDNTVLIDILLYKNKTSRGTSIIFFLLWTLPNPTHQKINSLWSRKEDFRYSVTKVGNEITKVRKIKWFVTCLWMFWKTFDGKTEEKLKDSLKLIWPLKYGNFLQTFLVLNSSCH